MIGIGTDPLATGGCVRRGYTPGLVGRAMTGGGVGIRWFRSRRAEAESPQGEPRTRTAAADGASAAAEAMPQSVISHVPGVKVDVQIKLPGGSKSRVTHFSRIGSPSLGRVRLGVRNLALHQEPDAQGALWLVGELAADAAHEAFVGRAAEGAATDWQIPLDDGVASVQVLLQREDVPA